ncbi:MAG TPA: hypothetical protein VFZ49_09025, partial [Pyrinomonadaceae bacterium]
RQSLSAHHGGAAAKARNGLVGTSQLIFLAYGHRERSQTDQQRASVFDKVNGPPSYEKSLEQVLVSWAELVRTVLFIRLPKNPTFSRNFSFSIFV